MDSTDEVALLVEVLRRKQIRVVFAESCTAGLVSASLATVPGISEYLCGSAVTYRDATKYAWLGVNARDVESQTAVSEKVAQSMALGVLRRTAEADYAASVTGHLGPGAPTAQDGIVYIGIARQDSSEPKLLEVTCHKLESSSREPRQQEAARLVLRQLRKVISA